MIKKDIIILLTSSNFFSRFKATLFELMLERQQLRENLEDYYLETKHQTLYIYNNNFDLKTRDRVLLLLTVSLTFCFCYIWKQLVNVFFLFKLSLALLRFVLVCFTSPQFYLLVLGLVFKIFDLISSFVVWAVNYATFSLTTTEAVLADLLPLRMMRVILNYKIFWFFFSLILLIYSNLFILSHLYISTLLFLHIINGFWLLFIISLFIRNAETRLDFEDFSLDFFIPFLLIMLAEGVAVNAFNSGFIREDLLPYAGTQNLEPSAWGYNSKLSQGSKYTNEKPLIWYTYPDDNFELNYPDFEEISSPYFDIPSKLRAPGYNPPMVTDVPWDYSPNDVWSLYKPFAREWAERYGVIVRELPPVQEDPEPLEHSKVYHLREISDWREAHSYTYDVRVTILDEIKYGHESPNVLKHYMKHLYSDIQKKNGTSDD